MSSRVGSLTCVGIHAFITLHDHARRVIARFLEEHFHGRSILVATDSGYNPGFINTQLTFCASMLSLHSTTTGSAITIMMYTLSNHVYPVSPLVILGHTQSILVNE